jgi:hypothetical protein
MNNPSFCQRKGNDTMKKATQISHTGRDERVVNVSGGLPVRTNLRAGLAWGRWSSSRPNPPIQIGG